MKTSLPVRIKSAIFHLRFNVSLLFLPVFLWGYVLTGSDINQKFLRGILILHFLIYPAMNGIYAYFDRARGVISRIKNVEPASLFTLVVSVIFLVAGIYLSFNVNTAYFIIVLIISVLFFLYSYPGTGIKSRPFFGILFVSISYGLFGFLAGWVCAMDLGGLRDFFNIVAILSSVGFIAGLYTLSLVYRVSEDSDRRGDLFVEKLGSIRTFKFAKIILPLSALLATIVIAGKFSLYEIIGIVIYFLIGFLVIDRFEKNFHLQKEWQNYKTIMSINSTNSIVLSLYLFFRILAVHYLLID